MRFVKATLAGVALLATVASSYAQSYGFGTYGGRINVGGTPAFGSGLASSAKLNGLTGRYTVTFTRPVDACIFTASVIGANPGYATASNKPGDPNTLFVQVFNGSGAAANLAFNVIVTCAS